MTFIHRVRRAVVAMLTGAVLACGAVSTPIVIGALTPAAAQISEDAQIALEQYGSWRRIHASAKPGASRGATRLASIEYGQWVYTDEWGWYWVSDDVEANWPLGCL